MPLLIHRQDTPEHAARRALFQRHAKVSFTGNWMVVESNCLPNHPHGDFPNRDNPNTIRSIALKYWIPMHPKKTERPTRTPFGPIGIAVNGIPFFNQYKAEDDDAVRLETFDSCCGHPNQDGMYHDRKEPVCIKSPFKEVAGRHSPLLGYAVRRLSHRWPRTATTACPRPASTRATARTTPSSATTTSRPRLIPISSGPTGERR